MNSGAVTIVYDGDGNRVAKTVSGVTTQYLVDDQNPTGYSQVVEEVVNGAVTRQYTYGLQRIGENQVVNSTWTPSFYGYDGGGNVRQLTSSAGVITDNYSYDAFGNLTDKTGTTPNNYLYRGEQYDSDLGLYYLRARYYNPATGRFLSRDPEDGIPTDPKTLHKYTYAGGDPVNFADPSGRAQAGAATLGGDLGEYADLASLVAVASEASEVVLATAVACALDTAADTLGIAAMGGDPIPEPAKCTAKCKPRTVEDIKRDCTPVGPLVIEPATGRAYKGCTSYEQEYTCGCGHPYSIHWIVCGDDPDGPPVHGPHPRGGPPKGGSAP
jgi:RHS repeat-associated protein